MRDMELLLGLLKEDPVALMPVVKALIEKYKPVVYSIAQEFVEVEKDLGNNKEYPAAVARVKKNMYDAYVEVGFTEDQALALMINDNIRLMENAKKISNTKSKSTYI